ncbi:MAG: transglycosylase SLT domain-containing protein [Bacteroidota bacterium]|nr:transglycosylase SLT domain-containing protein [Bacteroidota bacterium]MDX5431349.1 transglycosylase SLT domain-containing protein [Bacteroidota bacterium]MDX5470077.1 transglycosylase SLT domain-containing protein [Bacteroidota bacterium]
MIRHLSLFLAGALLTAVLFLSLAGKREEHSMVINHPNGTLTIPKLPSDLNFAGEPAKMDDTDVKERLDRELLVNTFWHSNTILMLKRANKYFPVIEPILEKNGVPDDFKYLCMIESGLANVVSPSNAAGFWQFLSSTGKTYGLEINSEVDERFHLTKATEAACAYLKSNKERLGSWTLAAAAYNMGENGVERQLQSQGVSSYYDLHLNTETARYLFRILAAKEIYSHPEAYGFQLEDEALYTPIPTRSVEVDSAVANWPEFALEQGTNYKYLKVLNPWIASRSLKNKDRKKYTVLLPKNAQAQERQIEVDPGSDE